MKLKGLFRTWQAEAAVICIVLAVTVVVSGGDIKEWIGAFAVLFTFMHAQVADRMAEKQAEMINPSVGCHAFSARYYMVKEALWIIYFILSHTWAALTGGIIFLAYPFWRRWYRSMS